LQLVRIYYLIYFIRIMIIKYFNLCTSYKGHDNGLIVFKLERERPAYAVHQNNLFYIKDKYLRVFDFANASDVSVLSVRKIGGQYVHPRSLSYNPAERAVIITTVSYDLRVILTSLNSKD
jgi:hypothetical protein